MSWWNPETFADKLPHLKIRMELVRAIRSYFDGREFYEVETPALQISPCMEAHLKAFKTELINSEQDSSQTYYLHTSPEFAMKKLLVAGLPEIYQICHAFRNAEGSHLHSAEFTMIEWYRSNADYHDIMDDCMKLLRHCATKTGIKDLQYKGRVADLYKEWEVITVCDAFQKYANFDLERYLDDYKGFAEAIKQRGIHVSEHDRWDDLFFRIFLEKIETKLGIGQPTILYDYPVCMAALSRAKEKDPRFAERFELYICGMELANAFGELTDPAEQQKRFSEEGALKQEIYGESYPVDEDFLSALEYGMPESSGIALGIDRLAMLFSSASDIDQVLWCQKP